MEGYSELLREILNKRGIHKQDEAELFLHPDYEKSLHDPYLMRDMERAVVRLFKARESGEHVVVCADYDCDGIPGAVIMDDLFRLIGLTNYEVYIPERNSEGYGLNMVALEEFKVRDTKLLITIDLGITAVEEVAQAKVYGMDTIVTDHHLPHDTLPRAYAILNPKIDDYPEKMLCGAGVVFKLAQGFIKKYGEYFKIKDGAEKWMLDMAGLATLSDMVPLLGENRAIAYFGMKVLRKSPRPGLQKLLKKMKIDQRYLTEDDIGFMVTPRLNAASRMDSPRRSYELLSTHLDTEAGALAEHLCKINDERKYIVANIMKDIKKSFEHREMREVIVVGNPSWRVGVLGLVAGKIMDEYERPVFVWGKDENDLIKGSCRSPGTVSVVDLMSEAGDHFLDFGGHELAGGFTVVNDKVHFLEEVLSQIFGKIKRTTERDEEGYDLRAGLDLVSLRNCNELDKLAPFGCENPKPVFLFEDVSIEKIKQFGKNGSGEHLEIVFTDANGKSAKAVSFFSGLDSFNASITNGNKVNLKATLECSRFGGRTEARLRVVDIF